jgi:hypothetical protein
MKVLQQDLLMNATVLADFQTDAATVRVQFNGWYHCNPGGADCTVLQPGSSTQIQVELYTRISERLL